MSDRPTITPTENGPFRVDGLEAITNLADGQATELTGTTFLCRCGASGNKPFCDGSHVRVGFSGEVTPDRQPDRLDGYTSTDGRITIHDNRNLCAHVGRCTDNLAAVFRLGTEPWIDADAATAEQIAAVIEQCPSGALSYTIDGTLHRDWGDAPSLGFAPGGPYMVSGGAELVDVDLPQGGTTDHCALCRCGASDNKPFCSGKHWYVDFDGNGPAGSGGAEGS